LGLLETSLTAMPVHTSPLEARLAGIVGPSLANLGYELVRVQVMGKERITVQVMAERADQAPIGSEDLELIARQLSAVLDVEDPIKGAWTLECSSPGIDRPLTRPKDFARFAGHLARLECEPAIDGQRKFSGQLLGLSDDAVRLKLDTGDEAALPLASIRKAKLVLTEALIAATRPAAPN
jgi:ribosome maturation factor RimP